MFFGLANSLRSLTRSPLEAALQEARRMARRHLEAGGSAGLPRKDPKVRPDAAEFIEGDVDDELYPLEHKKLGECGAARPACPAVGGWSLLQGPSLPAWHRPRSSRQTVAGTPDRESIARHWVRKGSDAPLKRMTSCLLTGHGG